MNHGWGGIINPKRPVAADANGLILLPLSDHSGHGRICYWFAPVAKDPFRTFHHLLTKPRALQNLDQHLDYPRCW